MTPGDTAELLMDAAVPAAARPAGGAAARPRRPVIRQYELVERVQAYDPDADEDLLNRAYVFAMKAHGAQLRASGDPYFHHPVEVAGILTGFKLDSASIATALLHDTVEDTGATLERDRAAVRPDGGPAGRRRHQAQPARAAVGARPRRPRISASCCWRCPRTSACCWSSSPTGCTTCARCTSSRARRSAGGSPPRPWRSTRPLAERIGMETLKAELEDLAFAELRPDARESVLHRLRHLRQGDVDLVDRIVRRADAGAARRPASRPRSPAARRRPTRSGARWSARTSASSSCRTSWRFGSMSTAWPSCYAALGVIHGAYHMLPGPVQGLHQHAQAQRLPLAAHDDHRARSGARSRCRSAPATCTRWPSSGSPRTGPTSRRARVTEGKQYRWIRELLDILEHAAGPEEFLEHTKLEMFQDQVFCFTPKGDLIALPRGATPVDFAYAVHSQVGDRCVGAKIDGRWCSCAPSCRTATRSRSSPARAARRRPSGSGSSSPARRARGSGATCACASARTIWSHGRELLTKAARQEQVAVTDKQLERVLEPLRQKSVDDLLSAVERRCAHAARGA